MKTRPMWLGLVAIVATSIAVTSLVRAAGKEEVPVVDPGSTNLPTALANVNASQAPIDPSRWGVSVAQVSPNAWRNDVIIGAADPGRSCEAGDDFDRFTRVGATRRGERGLHVGYSYSRERNPVDPARALMR